MWGSSPHVSGPWRLLAHWPCPPCRAAIVLMVQNGCMCSSHHLLIPANRKKKKWEKEPPLPFKDTSWKLHTSAYLLLARAVTQPYLTTWEAGKGVLYSPWHGGHMKTQNTPKMRSFNKERADTGRQPFKSHILPIQAKVTPFPPPRPLSPSSPQPAK